MVAAIDSMDRNPEWWRSPERLAGRRRDLLRDALSVIFDEFTAWLKASRLSAVRALGATIDDLRERLIMAIVEWVQEERARIPEPPV